MTERPIIFSPEMVRAILEGRKTLTRRVIKPQPMLIELPNDVPFWAFSWGAHCSQYGVDEWTLPSIIPHCPYGQLGDRLWVREAWWTPPDNKSDRLQVAYKALIQPYQESNLVWRNAMFMPRWASRITLEIVKVRVERLQEIQMADLIAEGFGGHYSSYSDYNYPGFRAYWDSLNGKRGFAWHVNPWVWVIEFKEIPRT